MLKEVTGTAIAAALGAGSWGIALAQTPLPPGASSRIPAVTQAPDGSTRYVFGTNIEPLLTCRPLFVCDVTLQAGERILNIAIGDSVRWIVATAQSGPGGETPHIFLKPTERDLAWFFKLFSLRGMVEESERMCFFAFLQKSDDFDF